MKNQLIWYNYISALFRAFSFGNCIHKQIVLINIRRLCKTFYLRKKNNVIFEALQKEEKIHDSILFGSTKAWTIFI